MISGTNIVKIHAQLTLVEAFWNLLTTKGSVGLIRLPGDAFKEAELKKGRENRGSIGS